MQINASVRQPTASALDASASRWSGCVSPTPQESRQDFGEKCYTGSGKLKGKAAVITGGDSGIGRAVALAFAREGRHPHLLPERGIRREAPLDNNVCERALKRAILHRKNALFYKTRNGAGVGDLFMSLIYTCQLNQANPFDYLTQLQRHAEAVAACPGSWMPWNYREALACPLPDRVRRSDRGADGSDTRGH